MDRTARQLYRERARYAHYIRGRPYALMLYLQQQLLFFYDWRQTNTQVCHPLCPVEMGMLIVSSPVGGGRAMRGQ